LVGEIDWLAKGESGKQHGGELLNDRLTEELQGIAIVSVLLEELRPGQVIRVAGIDRDYVSVLSDCDDELPPILVQKGSLRIIDGLHRWHAARIRGNVDIRAQLLDVNDEDAFRYGLLVNMTHGLTLTLADRKAAALKLLQSHPDWSDRAVGQLAGLSGKTVGSLRRAAPGSSRAQPADRRGQDGRMRPVDSAARRQSVRSLVASRPEASLREIAKEAGVSAGTVRRMRHSLSAETAVTSAVPAARRSLDDSADQAIGKSQQKKTTGVGRSDVDANAILEQLLRDPSLKYQKSGRDLLRRLLHARPILSRLREAAGGVPVHCVPSVAQLVRIYGEEWLDLARHLETRADAS
jgi:ParB-like chromosome segregation protein Spo0J